MKLASIIIANYNNSIYLKKSLDSVLNQTYESIELLIIDDGSTDDSIKIIQEFYDRNFEKLDIKLFLNKENQGGGKVKQFGINNAKGDYCCFLDSDDWLEPLAIKRLVSIFDQKENKDVSLIYTNAYKVIDDQIDGILNYAKEGSDMLKDRVSFHLAMWRSSLYQLMEDKFTAHLNIAYDIDLYMKLEEVGRVLFLNEPLYNYRIHENNISIGFSKLGYSMTERILARWEAQKRRNQQNTKLLGEEFQATLEKINKNSKKNMRAKELINALLKKIIRSVFS